MSSEGGFKLVLEKQKLIDMLKKLTVSGEFSDVEIIIKDNKLISRQLNKGNIYRIIVFKQSYFKNISGSDSFVIDGVKLLKNFSTWLKKIPKNEVFTIEGHYKKLHFSSEKASFDFDISENLQSKTMPFSFEGGIPIFNNGVKLDTYFKFQLKDVKRISRRIKEEYISFVIKDGKLSIFIWHPDYKRYGRFICRTKHKIFNGDELIVTFDHNIANVFQVFSCEMIHVHTKTGKPAWFSEETDDYALGIMVANNDDVDESPIF